jgi:hypothetical protein
LQTHNTKPDGSVTTVGCLGRFGWVKIDVDYIIESADGNLNGIPELFVVEISILIKVGVEHDGAKITYGSLFIACIKCNLSAKVGAVDNAAMVLRAAHIAGIFESNPWVTRLEDHAEHGLPEIKCGAFLPKNFTALGHGFVFAVAVFESFTIEVVKVGALIGAEECPFLTSFHPFHEEVGDPVGRIHVMSSAAVVSGIFTKLEEIVDVVMPGLEVCATGSPTLAALVNGDELIVVQFEEWDNTLRLAIGPFDKAASAADGCPRAT